MNALFADTFYYLALLSRDDATHERAVEVSRAVLADTVTTAWVLTEVADALAAPAQRGAFLTLLNSLRADPNVVIIPPSNDLFQRGISLYGERLDKDWSLTDCISFVVMRDHGMAEALTGDHHFEQAGFRILLG